MPERRRATTSSGILTQPLDSRGKSPLAAPVHWAEVDGVVIVLDERRGRYLALPPCDVPAWRDVVSGESPASDLLDEVRRRGWLGAAAARARVSRLRTPWRRALTLRALWCLVAVEVRLDIRGFGAAYAAARRSARCASAPSVTPARALAAFRRAENLIVSKRRLRDCLPRSLALFVFLRGCGFDVLHRIGVQRYPFAAHAWVEDESAGVLLDAPERVRAFTPLAELA